MKLSLKSFFSLIGLFLLCEETGFGWYHWHGREVVVVGPVYDPFYPHTVYVESRPEVVYVKSAPNTVYVESPSKTMVQGSSSFIDTEPALNAVICGSIDRFSWVSQNLPDSLGSSKELYRNVKSSFENYRTTTYPKHNHGTQMDACSVLSEKTAKDVQYMGISLKTDPQVEDDFVKGSLCQSIKYLRTEIDLFRDNVFTVAKNVLVENLNLIQRHLMNKYPGYNCPL